MSEEAGQTKSEVNRTGQFAVPAEKLWSLVSDFGGIDKILDGVECSVEGEGVGARRTIPSGGGGVTVESLDVLDNDAMTLTYSIIESPLPFRDYSATMMVTPEGDDSSQLSWTGSFLPAEGVPTEKAEHIAGRIYEGGIAGYSKAVGS